MVKRQGEMTPLSFLWIIIFQRNSVFCSMHLSLLSATLAPQKRKVNMHFFKKLSLCGLLKYSQKCMEFYEKVHHPAGQPLLFCRKSAPVHRDVRQFCNPTAEW